ncbi:MAG: hypothetical protein KBF48_07230 [Xanthomonadales bacterium]|nr:hypothetical protein [Xanthomonadales bacterium]
MIVSYSTIEDVGAGFRSKLFLPRWKAAKEGLREIPLPKVPALRVRLVIGNVPTLQDVQGFEDETTFVVENRIPIEQFKQLSIREKNDLVLDTIFESIKAVYAHFGEIPPLAIEEIWKEVRALP